MRYYLIRHAQTDATRLTRAAYGKQGAPINTSGREQAQAMRKKLIELGIDIEDEPAAVSALIRTQQTAQVAGFKKLAVYNILNEVKTDDPHKTQALIKSSKLPPEAGVAAKKILNQPPEEKIWVTHGQVIAALLQELNLTDPAKFMPDFCEVRIIEF